MGRALLITLTGILAALSYTFLDMNRRSQSMGKRNVDNYNALMAKNTAHTGVQLAINEYDKRKSDGDQTNDEFKNLTVTIDQADLSLALAESTELIDGDSTDVITVTSRANYKGSKHEVEATFDISQKQSLLPNFISAISFANGNIYFQMGNNNSQINGIDDSGDCQMQAPGITMPTTEGVSEVESSGGYEKGHISGNPPVKMDHTSIDFSDLSDLIEALSQQPNTRHLNGGTWNDDLGTATNPGVFIVENPTKIQSNGTGYGVLVIRSGGELELEGDLDLRGKFEFNGLVIFENSYNFDSAGTPDINGSVIFGVDEYNNTSTTIALQGTVSYQFDCDAKIYAEDAVDNSLNTTLYQPLSVYE